MVPSPPVVHYCIDSSSNNNDDDDVGGYMEMDHKLLLRYDSIYIPFIYRKKQVLREQVNFSARK